MRERLAERARSASAHRRFRPVPIARLRAPGGDPPILNALPVPLDPRGGGVPGQLRVRLEVEESRRPVALLARAGRRYVLYVTDGTTRVAAPLGPATDPGPPALRDAGAEGALEAALGATRARVLHLEGAAGWPLEGVAAVLPGATRLVLSVHDFALFCPRPHLVEEPSGAFCGYSIDDARCGRCLRASWTVEERLIGRWRRAAAALLERSDAVVFASRFLLDRHRTLFPGPWAGRGRVIPPAVPSGLLPGGAERAPRSGRPPHVAFVGAYRPHKGALLFEAALGRLDPSLRARVRWSVFGGGDPALLRRARRLGVHVLGYYRFGSLPSLLRRRRVDLALILSIWPEAYSITLTECRQAGVPVAVLAMGAPGERVGAEGSGHLLDPARAEQELTALLERVARGELEVPPHALPEPEPGPEAVGDAWCRVYAELGAAARGTA